ncbi:MAG: LPS export ABC transporter permease LptG [Syntrophales bacterium]|nr:LPS export ABC transporter permease LptG [Syntrophales bacterium]
MKLFRIINRYILSVFLSSLILILVSLISVYLIVDFFGKLRMFISNHASYSQVLRFFLHMIPVITTQMVPAAILLATLVTFGSLSRYNEIVAFKANGISIYSVALPVILAVMIMTPALFFFSELIVPKCLEKAEYIRLVEVQKRKRSGSFKQNQIWYRGAEGIYNFHIFDEQSNTIRGVTLNFFDKNFELVKRIDAEKAVWNNGKWEFYNVFVITFTDGNYPELEFKEKVAIEIPEKPEDFKHLQKDAEKMGFFELFSYVKKLNREGYDTTRYIADLHSKVAMNVICIIFVLLGIGFSLRKEKGVTLTQSIGAGVLIGFSYWLVHAFSLSLGRAGVLPPIPAAWAADFIFVVVAYLVLRRVHT